MTIFISMKQNRLKLFSKTLCVRISNDQYTRLLEAIIKEKRNGNNLVLKPLEKSSILREMIDKYTLSCRS